MVMVLLDKFQVHTVRFLSCFTNGHDCYPSLDSALCDALIGHLISARCLHCLPVSLRCVQKPLSRSVEESGVLAPEWSVERRAHLPRVKEISYGLKSMFETFLRLLQSTHKVVRVQTLEWGGMTQQRSCRTIQSKSKVVFSSGGCVLIVGHPMAWPSLSDLTPRVIHGIIRLSSLDPVQIDDQVLIPSNYPMSQVYPLTCSEHSLGDRLIAPRFPRENAIRLFDTIPSILVWESGT